MTTPTQKTTRVVQKSARKWRVLQEKKIPHLPGFVEVVRAADFRTEAAAVRQAAEWVDK